MVQCVVLPVHTYRSPPAGNISHKPGRKLLLLSARHAFTFPAVGHHRP